MQARIVHSEKHNKGGFKEDFCRTGGVHSCLSKGATFGRLPRLLRQGKNTFSFKDGVNPLEFVEDDAFGDQVYEQFVGMDYEALAERKRKALEDSRPEGSVKKARHEDVTGASMEEIMEAMNYGMQRRIRKPKNKGRRKGSKKKLTPEITRRLGEATLHYVHGRYEEDTHLGRNC
ncbi:unnamed protein product [Prunus brigantina]